MKTRIVPGILAVAFAVLIGSGPALFADGGTFSIGMGYQLGLTKKLDPKVQNGEAGEVNVTNGLAFNLRYLPGSSRSVGVVVKGSFGGLNKMVWQNPAYTFISSGDPVPAGGWGGFTATQLDSLKDYLPQETYTFTKDNGTLLYYEVFLGGAFEILLIEPFSVILDAGLAFHHRNVSYREILEEGRIFSAELTTSTIGFGLGIGAQFAFTDMFYAELGASFTWDFLQFGSTQIKVDDTSIIDTNSHGKRAGFLNFGTPYILLGIKL
ncbi:hypothetical protein FACS189468_3740 [Spirochaetia bacterium]|nr:hypothetical protein FACS189468_3740 [Spirochaetia bacterium]